MPCCGFSNGTGFEIFRIPKKLFIFFYFRRCPQIFPISECLISGNNFTLCLSSYSLHCSFYIAILFRKWFWIICQLIVGGIYLQKTPLIFRWQKKSSHFVRYGPLQTSWEVNSDFAPAKTSLEVMVITDRFDLHICYTKWTASFFSSLTRQQFLLEILNQNIFWNTILKRRCFGQKWENSRYYSIHCSFYEGAESPLSKYLQKGTFRDLITWRMSKSIQYKYVAVSNSEKTLFSWYVIPDNNCFMPFLSVLSIAVQQLLAHLVLNFHSLVPESQAYHSPLFFSLSFDRIVIEKTG